jgi:hypothetical protein
MLFRLLLVAGHCRYPPVADARKAPCCRRRFRPLAFASVLSSGVSVLAVTVFPSRAGPVWSIAGISLGEAAAPFKR